MESNIDVHIKEVRNLGKIEVVILRCYPTPEENEPGTPSETAAALDMELNSSEEIRAVHFADEPENLTDSGANTPVSSIFNKAVDNIALCSDTSGLTPISGEDPGEEVTASSGTEYVEFGQMLNAMYDTITTGTPGNIAHMVASPIQADPHWLNGFESHQTQNNWQDEEFISTTPFFTSARPVLVADALTQPVQDFNEEELTLMPRQENTDVSHIPPAQRNY